MSKHKHSWLASAGAVSVLVLGAGGVAAAQSAPAAPPSKGVSQIEEVVVTARRVTERLQDVPLSVAAISSQEIAKRQIEDLNDIADAIPNVSIGGSVIPGAAAIQIRGSYSNVLPDASLDSSLGHYIDGVYIARLTAGEASLADISRVEVLRGPQGTLFGRNVTQGAINFITADPTGHLHALVEGTVGDYHNYRAHVMIDLPEWHGFSLRAAYLHHEADGDVRNVLGGTTVTWGLPAAWTRPFGTTKAVKTYRALDDNGYFVALRYTGIENLTVTYKYDRADDVDAPPVQQVEGLPTGASANSYATDLVLAHPGTIPISTSALRSVPSPFSSATTIHNFGHDLVFEYRARPDITLKSITAYRGNDTAGVGDTTGGAPSLAPGVFLFSLGGPTLTWQTQVSEEAQLIAHEKRFDFTGGLYYFQESGGIQFGLIDGAFYGALGGKPVFTNDGVNQLNVLDQALSTNESANNRSYAVYGHTDIHVTDKLDLSGGVRYTDDKRKVVADSFSFVKLLTGQNPLTLGVVTPYRGTNISYDVTGSYKLRRDVNAYVRWATGYLSGGARGVVAFKPELTNALEIGLKSEWLDHRLRLNVDYFHDNTKDLQVTQFDFVNGVKVINVGSYHANGVEFESTYLPFEGMHLEWDWGYNHAVYSDGRRNGSPEFNTNLEAEYEFPRASNGAYFDLRVDGNYRSKYYGAACSLTEPASSCHVVGGGGYAGPLPTAFLAMLGYPGGDAGTLAYQSDLDKAITLGDYWVVNLRASILDIPVADGKAKASFWIKNVADERGGQELANFGTFLGGIREPGRTFGFDLAWQY
jgi:iron complex outermembrane receptor protein